MSGSATDKVAVKCACGAKMKVPASAAGRRARCPRCGEVFKVPARGAAPSGAVAFEGAAADLPETSADAAADSLLDDFAEQEGSAEVIERPDAPLDSPPQSSLIRAPDSFGGGSDSEPGTLLSGALAAKGFLIGCVFSAIAAAVGAGIWYGIAIGTGYEIGYVAWGIGLAAGAGMAYGSRSAGVGGGAVAAVMATLSIVVAKLLIFNAVVAPAIGELRVEYAAAYLTDEALTERGVEDEEEREDQWDAIFAKQQERVEAMPEGEFQQAFENGLEAFDDGEAWPTFFNTSFELFDLLFFGLAIVTAFKLGASGFGASD